MARLRSVQSWCQQNPRQSPSVYTASLISLLRGFCVFLDLTKCHVEYPPRNTLNNRKGGLTCFSRSGVKKEVTILWIADRGVNRIRSNPQSIRVVLQLTLARVLATRVSLFHPTPPGARYCIVQLNKYVAAFVFLQNIIAFLTFKSSDV